MLILRVEPRHQWLGVVCTPDPDLKARHVVLEVNDEGGELCGGDHHTKVNISLNWAVFPNSNFLVLCLSEGNGVAVIIVIASLTPPCLQRSPTRPVPLDIENIRLAVAVRMRGELWTDNHPVVLGTIIYRTVTESIL